MYKELKLKYILQLVIIVPLLVIVNRITDHNLLLSDMLFLSVYVVFHLITLSVFYFLLRGVRIIKHPMDDIVEELIDILGKSSNTFSFRIIYKGDTKVEFLCGNAMCSMVYSFYHRGFLKDFSHLASEEPTLISVGFVNDSIIYHITRTLKRKGEIK